MDNFSEWLLYEMNTRGFSQSELARRANISQSMISHVINGRRNPGTDFCKAIAHALKMPPKTVLLAAGIFSEKSETDPSSEELLYLFQISPPNIKEEILDFARFKTKDVY